MIDRIAVLIQGPLYNEPNGSSTLNILRQIDASKFRCRFFVVCALWEDELDQAIDEVEKYADKTVICPKPQRAGTGNRNYQRHGVSYALEAIEHLGIGYVLKTRTDILLSEKFLRGVVKMADSGFAKVLVTNIFTRYESFHISDLVLFSTFGNMKAWFDTREVYYEDLYSSEVQFPRVFIRNKKLKYTMRLEDYLAFLRDWVVLKDWHEQELGWLKPAKEGYNLGARDLSELSKALGDTDFGPLGKVLSAGARRNLNKARNLLARTDFSVLYDRDAGPIAARTMSISFHRFISGTKVPLPLVAVVLLISDLVLGYLLRYVPLLKGRWSYYTIDPKISEHEKPVV